MAEGIVTVRFRGGDKAFSVFQGLLTQGFECPVKTGGTLKHVLCRQLGISESYLNERVQTIFLNGRAVDDLVGEVVGNNSTIALSAAMPGLAGAVFRKGGMLSSLRNPRAGTTQDASLENRLGRVTLKLFNLIAAELGPEFFKNGILIKKEQLIHYLGWKKDLLHKACPAATVDGRQVETDALASSLAGAEYVRLFVNGDE
jgi:hypothetical protein